MKALPSFVRIGAGWLSFTLCVLALIILSGCRSTSGPTKAAAPSVQSVTWGHATDGTPVQLCTLKNRHGMTVKISTLGATITEVWVPDQKGVFADVVLGSE